MMAKFSQRSLDALANCHNDLRRVAFEAIQHYDFIVLCGFRTQHDQDDAFRQGNSDVRWPNSPHNVMPSAAMDIAPYPIDWSDIGRFRALGKVIMDVAKANHIALRWPIKIKKGYDYPHFELVSWLGMKKR